MFVIFLFTLFIIVVALLSMWIGARIGIIALCEYLYTDVERTWVQEIIDKNARAYKYSCLNTRIRHKAR